LFDAPLWAVFVAAVPTGASVPQVGPMVRARWADGPFCWNVLTKLLTSLEGARIVPATRAR
ncbi:hypothetical protein ABZ322_42965, partial [Streptomyces sp. NPDC006129]|uniref:hypothetical protein n=1 Tax=Streptomyces sp. NPDC006129 TaxID=3155348 RepID=UPI0033A51421